jgi:hypothetical protein
MNWLFGILGQAISSPVHCFQLPFVIAYVSSETEEHPAKTIVNASPDSLAWLSSPNAPFPQDLVLDFAGIVSLTQREFGSHQSKILS